jgi:hypothetical protein
MMRTVATMTPERWRELAEQYATPRQRDFLAAIDEHGSASAAERALGVSGGVVRRSMCRLRARVAQVELEPHRDPDRVAPGMRPKGTSTAHQIFDEASGKWITHWVKTERDPNALALSPEDMRAALADLEGLARKLPGPKARRDPERDLLSVIPMGDPHFGMYAWGAETGQYDFDLKIAEERWQRMMDRAVAALPYTERAVFIQLGDLTHGNDHKNVTPGSGHVLDVDTRHQQVMRVAFRAMIYAAERMREKCERLTIESIPGNHSPDAVLGINLALEAYFRRENDVHVSMSARDIRLVAEFGAVMITASHGDKQKPERLGSLVPAHYAAEWGRTKHRYHHGGHVHHTHVRDLDGLRFESHRSPAPMDAYAAARYWSEQSVAAIVYHRDRGEVERHTIGL